MIKEVSPSPLFFICVLLTLFLAIFYNTVTNMAGIYIVSDLGGSTDISLYPMVFFGLGNALSIALALSLAERWGAIKLLVYGLLSYTFFSLLCGIASTFFLFNLYRFGLGLSSGLFYILCRKLIFVFSPTEKLENYSIVMISMYAIVPVLGACFGAWLAYENVWRWIFHVNAPVAFVLALYFWVFFRHLDEFHVAPSSFDTVGCIFFFLAAGSLVSAVTLAQELDWFRSPLFTALVCMGVPSLLFFVLWEWNHPEPLLDIKLLQSPLLSYALLNLAILFSAYFGIIILITLWLKLYVNYTPLWISILIGIMATSGFLAYTIGKTFLRHFDPRFTLGLAIGCLAGSCYYSVSFNVEVDFFHLAVARCLSGVGLVLFLFPLFSLAFCSHGPEKFPKVFTLFQVVRALFSSLGAAFYTTLWQRRQFFFYERLGEGLTPSSQLSSEFLHRAVDRFHLTKNQAADQLHVFLYEQATSLALNDVFGCMGWILTALLVLLVFSFVWESRIILERK